MKFGMNKGIKNMNVNIKMTEKGESLREHRMEMNIIEKSLRDLYYDPVGKQLQIDLIFMGIENNKSKWAKENYNYGYIVAAIEILSRYAFAIPTKKKTKEEVTAATETILGKFREHFRKVPEICCK